MLIWAIGLPFLFAIVVSFVRRLTRFHTGWLVLPLPVVLFIYFLSQVSVIQSGSSIFETVSWIPSLGINLTLTLDGLSLLFTLLISGIGILVIIYSIFYLNKRSEGLARFYIYLQMFMGAMLGVVLSDNLMVLYAFWELTSITSFLLISFWYRRERSRYGALKSMLITVFGGLAMFAGFNLLYVMTGSYSISEIINQAGGLGSEPMFVPALLLILIGAFTKSAQFPFHIWLPDAMEAPTPISAYLHSATMVKAGIYLVARMTPVFGQSEVWFWLVSLVGLVTLIYGSVTAIKQFDLKALLAYSTISQLGLIMCLLGLGSAAYLVEGTSESVFYTMATTAAIFHLINHAIFKGSLFMVVGIIDHETGTRDLRRLGGLMSIMPITFTVAVIGAGSMAGLPPFSGFLSKEMFFTAVLNIRNLDIFSSQAALVVFPVIAWIASVFTFVYSLILILRTFTGRLQPEKLDKPPHEAPIGLLLPPVILVSLSIVFALFPNLVSYPLIEPALRAIHPNLLAEGGAFEVSIHFWHGWTPEVFMTIGVIVLGLITLLLYRALRKRERISRRSLLDRMYDGLLVFLEKSSLRLTNLYMTGKNSNYVMYIFSFFIVMLLATLFTTQGIQFGMEDYAPLAPYEAIIIVVMALAALVVPFAKSRISAILFTGAVGYMVTLLYIVFRAPDLALTQMIIETVSVILFLLTFKYLPKLKPQKESFYRKLPKLIVSIGVGITMMLLALAAMGSSPFESISEYFLKESYDAAGGKNVVNVILVDFRGFDTLFEIMVLGIAALAIFSLIRLRLSSAQQKTNGVKGSAPQLFPLRSNDVILRTWSKVIAVIILLFSLHLFLAGHNNPGGGFIAGLMTSAALILICVAFGVKTATKILPVNYRILAAIGMAIALLTAAGSFLFGVPFLSHAFGHFDLPILGDTELATAVLFDLGVYLGVIGVTMNIILSIGGEERWNS